MGFPFLSSNVFLKSSRTFPSIIYLLPDYGLVKDKVLIKAGDQEYKIDDFELILTKIGNKSAIDS